MSSVTISLSHPILFVFDFSNPAFSVPEFDPNAPVSANSNGISIRSASEVDGEVIVNLTEAIPTAVASAGHEVFVGSIAAPSKRVAVVTAENEKLVEAAVPTTTAKIRVVVDDPEHAMTIWVEAR
jgi:hypothetical protein